MRIEDRSGVLSQVSLWVGVVVAVSVGFGAYRYFNQAVPEKDPSGKPYLRKVPSDSILRSRLSDAQWHVMRENGTETAFQNQYWDNFKPGLYVDAISGDPLFSSVDKFEANTGRPCFSKPINPDCVVHVKDTSHNMERVEVRAVKSNSHLGHVFNDGPPPTGLRYAINSAAMKFIPLENMEAQSYGEFIPFVKSPEAGGSPAATASK